MADSELSGIAADTTPDLTDIVYATDAAGTVDKKVAFGDFPFATLGYGFDLVTRSGFADADTVDIQEFTGSGTWTKPDGARVVHAVLVGGGGGGTSGDRDAAGTLRAGGGGGGPGYRVVAWLAASALDSTEAVTVGAGGTAGAARTTDGAGNEGTNGGDTVLDTIAAELRAAGGQCGQQTAGFTRGLGGTSGSGKGGYATVATVGDAVVRSQFMFMGQNGGGGAGLSRTVANADTNGGSGGATEHAAGGASSGAGANASNGGVGGGGAGGATTGTAGGAGGSPGGGGGGGAYATTGTNSGAGGAGGAGYALIITFL